MANFVRNNAWQNGGDFTNLDLLWYARGVQKMMSRSLDDTASWWFYAAIHGEYVNPKSPWYVKPPALPDWEFIQGPPVVQTAPLPAQAIQDTYWNQCQHATWYFLPWHRGYLLSLEAQLRADIASLGGPAAWALPYWDYFGGADGGQYDLPPAFAIDTLDAAPNPLYCAMRFGLNGDGKVFVPTPAWAAKNPGVLGPDSDVTKDCLNNNLFTGANTLTTSPGFGGPKTAFKHAGRGHGNMEKNPHDFVHGYVGGQNADGQGGLMSDPGTAALDPIFYLHHCNIDRLWAVWNSMGNSNPTDADWLNGPAQGFIMPWLGGKPWSYTPQQMADLGALNYTYQELAAPALPGPSVLAARFSMLGAEDAAKKVTSELAKRPLSKSPELLGASQGPVTVQGAGVRSVPVKMDARVWGKVENSLAKASETALPDRVYLTLESVRGVHDATVLGVYLNLPDNVPPADRRSSFTGSVALFGLRRASAKDGGHGGNGLDCVLDITRFIDEMYVKKGLGGGSIQVSLLPRRPLPGQSTIEVGRISLYREAH